MVVRVPLGALLAWLFEVSRLAKLFFWVTGKTRDSCGCSRREMWLNKFRIPIPVSLERVVRKWHQVKTVMSQIEKQKLPDGREFVKIPAGVGVVEAFTLVTSRGNRFRYRVEDPSIREFIRMNGYSVE